MVNRAVFVSVAAVILVINCIPSLAQGSDDTLKIMKYILDLSQDCFKGDITEEFVVKSMIDQNPNHDVKCFLGCTMKKIGLMNEDGSFSENGTKELLKKMPGLQDDKRDQLANSVIDKCGGLESEDECEKGYSIHSCGWGELKALSA